MAKTPVRKLVTHFPNHFVLMKEKLLEIVTILDACAKARKGTRIYPVARVHCLYNGQPDNIWFTSSPVRQVELSELGINKFGRFVEKNSNVAKKLQTMETGCSLGFDNHLGHHYFVLENRSDLYNKTIAIAGEPLLYQYRDISEFLSALQENKEDIADIENLILERKNLIEDLKKKKGTAHQRGQLTKTINDLTRRYRILTQQQEDLKNITIYIRKQGEMRYSPIVDPVQTRIKSEHLFDGKTVIIDGGPGTGKSTTMIHRLAYLTDTFAIDEDENEGFFDYKLDSTQRNLLRKAITSHRDWIFFSPSPMLKEYLAVAMKKENLTNTHEKVYDWKTFCSKVLQNNYNLIGTDKSNAPFRLCHLKGTLFYQGHNIIREFSDFYLNELRGIQSRLPNLNSDGLEYAWTSIAKNIGQRFEGSENFDLGNFISLFNTLESVYANDCKSLLRDRNESIINLAEEIYILLEQNQEIKMRVAELLELTPPDREESEDEGIIEPEAADNAGEISEEEIKDSKLELLKAIQAWVKAYSLEKINGNVKLNDIQVLMSEFLEPLLGSEYDSQIQKIGQLMVFERYAQYTRGVKSIMLNGMPARYKRFRNHLLRTKYEGCNIKLLRDVMQRKQGKELHHQEQSLILGFINTLVKQIKTRTGSSIKHIFMDAYEEVSRPIIGIDEATDFSACDIYAMQSLLTREFNSLTLCGDRMQRLTSYGIKDWSELEGILPQPIMETMKTSYRQSKKLLEVARQMYTDTLHEPPSYRAFMKSNKVPDALVFVNKSENAKIEWISKRISEVYRAYGDQLPSIAVFVNDKGYIPNFIKGLQATEFFVNNNVKVLDGSDTSSNTPENHICVYSIDVVKGMEFDVVFFHNIDNSSADTETMKRYIYVGASRAAFFLGVTISEPDKEIIKYFEEDKDWFKI